MLDLEVAPHHRHDQLGVDRLGRVADQHGRQVRVDQLVAEGGRQRLVGLPGGLPLGRRVLVAVGAQVVVRDEQAVLRQQLGDAAEDPVDVRDVVAGRVVDHQVEAVLRPGGRVGVELVVAQRQPGLGRLLARADQQVLGVVDADGLLDQPGGDQPALYPAVAAVEHERLGEGPAGGRGQVRGPGHGRIAGGPAVEVSLDPGEVIPVAGVVVDAAVRGDRAGRGGGPLRGWSTAPFLRSPGAPRPRGPGTDPGHPTGIPPAICQPVARSGASPPGLRPPEIVSGRLYGAVMSVAALDDHLRWRGCGRR